MKNVFVVSKVEEGNSIYEKMGKEKNVVIIGE